MSIIPSFISEFFDKNNFVYSPDDIEDTSNGMWLKYNNISIVYSTYLVAMPAIIIKNVFMFILVVLLIFFKQKNHSLSDMAVRRKFLKMVWRSVEIYNLRMPI